MRRVSRSAWHDVIFAALFAAILTLSASGAVAQNLDSEGNVTSAASPFSAQAAPAGAATPASLQAGVKSLRGYTSGCIMCAMIGDFTLAADAAAGKIFDTFRADAFSILNYGFAIIIILGAIRLFLPFMGGDPKQIFGDLVRRSFVYALLAACLSSTAGSLFWPWVYTEAYSVAGTAAVAVMNITDQNGDKFIADAGESTCGQFTPPTGLGGAYAHLNQSQVEQWITCPMDRVEFQAELAIVLAYMPFSQSEGFMAIVTFITTLIFAVPLIILYGIVMLSFAFLLIDIVFRISLVASFAPLFLMLSLFKPTQQIGQKALTALAEAAVGLIFAAIAYGFFDSMMTQLPTFYHLSTSGDEMAALNNVAQDFIANHSDLTPISAGYWYLVAIAMFAIVAPKHAVQLGARMIGFHWGAGMGASALGIGSRLLGQQAALLGHAGGAARAFAGGAMGAYTSAGMALAYPGGGASGVAGYAAGRAFSSWRARFNRPTAPPSGGGGTP